MIASGSQNWLQSSLAPLDDLLKALMFLSNLNGFNSSPSPPVQGFNQRKCFPRCGRKRTLSDFITFFYLLVFVCCITCVFCLYFESVQFYALFCLTCFCLFIFSLFIYFVFDIKINKKIEKSRKKKIQKQCVLCVHWYLCTLDGH